MLDSSGIVNDCELDLVAAFHHLLDFHIPLKVDGDWARWRLKKNVEFDIHSFYNALRGSNSVNFLCKSIRGVKAPQRVSFFVWTVVWGKILTCDNLRERGYTIVDWFYMCRYSGEMLDHLLLHFKEAYQLWSFVF